MLSISESQLVFVVRSDALRQLRITQNELGNFLVAVQLNNQDGWHELVTFRKKPREWASLDRLAKHIREKYGAIPTITLNLFFGEATNEAQYKNQRSGP